MVRSRMWQGHGKADSNTVPLTFNSIQFRSLRFVNNKLLQFFFLIIIRLLPLLQSFTSSEASEGNMIHRWPTKMRTFKFSSPFARISISYLHSGKKRGITPIDFKWFYSWVILLSLRNYWSDLGSNFYKFVYQ